VVVVKHHDRPLGALDLLEHRIGEVVVDHAVAPFVGLHLVVADVWRVREVPEVVLDEPQHRVGDDVVEAVVGLWVRLDQADAVLAIFKRQVERLAAVLVSHLGVDVAHC
jgi:hypothetical protein